MVKDFPADILSCELHPFIFQFVIVVLGYLSGKTTYICMSSNAISVRSPHQHLLKERAFFRCFFLLHLTYMMLIFLKFEVIENQDCKSFPDYWSVRRLFRQYLPTVWHNFYWSPESIYRHLYRIPVLPR